MKPGPFSGVTYFAMNEGTPSSLDRSGLPSSVDAWAPLDPSRWDRAAATHLLRRACWSAQPLDVDLALSEGLTATLNRLFPEDSTSFPKPASVLKVEEEAPHYAARLKGLPEIERRDVQREERERSQQALNDLTVKWLEHASVPSHAAREKWVFFLSDVYVISAEKVRNPGLIYSHQRAIRDHSLGPAPLLAKAILRSPAMIQYLDLQQSQKKAPNENFARELLELFTLGEGHYSERDIKEAARAFTGYRQKDGEFFFAPKLHDASPKTVLGQSASFNGDQVIDVVYAQAAAGSFLPREMAKFYLTDQPLPDTYFDQLGYVWKSTGYDLRTLTHLFFGSRLFFESVFRDSFIKSPLQFYLGLVQDLDLSVVPFPRPIVGAFRQMGQRLFYPPNVRGWVGGRGWINSATLSARRQLVQGLFAFVNEATLNADEKIALESARSRGFRSYTVPEQQIETWNELTTEELATDFLSRFLGASSSPEPLHSEVVQFLKQAGPKRRRERIRGLAITLLQSPTYQLC